MDHRNLENWSDMHSKLSPAYENNPWLKEIREHSLHLSELATLGLNALSGDETWEEKPEDVETLFDSAKAAHRGTVLAVVDPVQKLVSSAKGK